LLRGAWSRFATVDQQEAEIVYERQQEAERDARQTLIVSVQNAYWELVAAKEQLGVSQNSVLLGEQQLHQNQRRLEFGVGTEVDVLQARSDVAVREEVLLRTETDLHQAMDDLKRIVFAARDSEVWETPIEAVTSLPEHASTEGVVGWRVAFESALEYRSDLRQSRFNVDSARVRHTRTLSNRLAALDLSLTASSASVGFNYAEVRDETFDYDFPTYTALLTYSLPIGNRTADYAERAARADVRSSLLGYDNLETTIALEVRRAVRDVFYRAEAVHAAEESLVLEQRQLDAEEARYKEGLTTTFQVLQFQQDLILQMSVERRARVEFMKALVALDAAQGLVGEQQP
jgi:outer membrane protein TolC